MNIQYRELFRIDCLHSYFSDGRCAALVLSPTPECGVLLSRYDCLFRPLYGGGVVSYRAAGGRDLFRLFDESGPFTFALTTTNPLLSTFSDTGVAPTLLPGECAYYFSNAQENVATIAGEERLLLHAPSKSLAAGPLPIRPTRFVYIGTAPHTGKKPKAFQVFDGLGRTVFAGQTPPTNPLAIPLDLRGFRDGRYSLQADGQSRYDFYLSNTAGRAPWGIVEVFAGGSIVADFIPPRCRPIDVQGNVGTPPGFTIALDARKSFWRYYIVSQAPDRRTYDDYSVVGGPSREMLSTEAEPVVFSGPMRQKVNNKDAWVFESTTAVPLCEFPAGRYEFALKPNSGGNGAAGPFPLPYAQTETTRLERTPNGTGSRMCSEIFVYL